MFLAMATFAPARPAFAPAPPQTIEDLGISQALVLDLMLRRLLLEGYSTLASLSEKLRSRYRSLTPFSATCVSSNSLKSKA